MTRTLTALATLAVALTASVAFAAPAHADPEPPIQCGIQAPCDPIPPECDVRLEKALAAYAFLERDFAAEQRHVGRLERRIERKNATIQRLREKLHEARA